jgi:hypothetical protein
VQHFASKQDVAQYFGNGEYHSEILNISQFFAIPCDTAHVDRVLSPTQGYWTRKKKMLNIGSLSGLSFLQYNFKGISHTDFRTILMSCAKLLNKILYIQKYEGHKKNDNWRTSSRLNTVCV